MSKKKESVPTSGEFLNFLAKDIQNNPQHLKSVDKNLVNHIQSLTSDVELDLNAPLSDEDEFFEQLLSSVKETDRLIKEVEESGEKEETPDAKTD